MRAAGALRSWAWYHLGLSARRLRRAPFPGVAVLAYHGVRDDARPAASISGGILHVSASRLAEHCRVLREVATPISGAQFLAAVDGAPLPPRPVLLTFDDGYASWMTHALPVLERFGVPAVMFLCTDPIARGIRFWFDAVAEREGAAAVSDLKAVEGPAWRAAVTRHESPATAGDPLAPLDPEGVRRLARSPLIELGGHSRTHPILARVSVAEQQDEIDGCAAQIAEWAGRAPRLFAYPNGRPGEDYTGETVRLVGARYRAAFAVGDRFTDPARHPFEQRRFLMLDSVSGPELAHRLARAWPRVLTAS